MGKVFQNVEKQCSHIVARIIWYLLLNLEIWGLLRHPDKSSFSERAVIDSEIGISLKSKCGESEVETL